MHTPSLAPVRFFIGLMSGTSLDGVDAVLVEMDSAAQSEHCAAPLRQLGQVFLPYPQPLKQQLLTLHQPSANELHQAAVVGNQLATLYATAVHQLLAQTAIPAKAITAIGNHGQTIRHCPDLPSGDAYTLQLGNHARLAELTGICVVGDFRSRDIAAGGQGAPLVPAFHQSVFASRTVHRVILNIGGIANLTNLPPEGPVTGFDTGPGNLLLDAWTQHHTGQPYDAGGQWAAQGQVNAALLSALLQEPYLHYPPPKSTGRDLFHLDWLRPHLNAHPDSPVNVACTLLEYTANTIVDALQQHCTGVQEVYLCGGGAHNVALVQRLLALSGLAVQATDALGVGADWVEAVAFAWLAQRCMDGQTANLPAVTGALGPRILGAVYPA